MTFKTAIILWVALGVGLFAWIVSVHFIREYFDKVKKKVEGER